MKKITVLIIFTLLLLVAGCSDKTKATSKPTTAAPTTAAPTTAKPTVAPTTAKPTVAPTTAKPTTAKPTTIAPLAAPVVKLEGNVVSWEAVSGATNYEVYIGEEKAIDTLLTSYTVLLKDSALDKLVSVVAVRGEESVKSNEVTISYTESAYTSWEKEDIAEEWQLIDSYREGVGEGFDLENQASISLVVKPTETAKYLTITARSFNNQEGDNPKGPEYVIYVNGTVVKAAGYATDEVTLPLNSDALFSYCYDLSSYVGEKVVIRLQKTYGHHLVINRVELSDKAALADSDKNTWYKDDIAAEWVLAGNYREGVGEGFDLNSYDNKISSIFTVVSVTEDNKYLAIRARMFSGQDGSGNPDDPYRSAMLVVRANGNILASSHAENGYVEVKSNSDLAFSYYFDLSEYVGQTIALNIAQESNQVGHCVIQSVSLGNYARMFDTANKTYYTKGDIESDWALTGFYRDGVGEGFDLNSYDRQDGINDDNRANISKAVEITANNALMVLNVRTFGNQDSSNPQIYVRVNNEVIEDKLTENVFIDVDCTKDDSYSRLYDLSSYIGQTVIINIAQQEKNAGHGVIRSISFTGLDESYSWDRTGLYENWAISGEARTGVGEGLDINPNSGLGGIINVLPIKSPNPILKIEARMFSGQDGNGSNEDPYRNAEIKVYVNGVEVAEVNGQNVLSSSTDDTQTFKFDLSAYAGKSVIVAIMSENSSVGHSVFQNISLIAVE